MNKVNMLSDGVVTVTSVTAAPKLLPFRFSRVEGGYLISDGYDRKADTDP